jgi:hypothetical protein
MSKNQETETAVALPATTPATVPSTIYPAAVQERIMELRRWREQIPRLTIPVTTDATKRLSVAASVSSEFIELTNIASTNHTPLVRAESKPADEIRDLVAYSDSYSPLADELEALAKFVRHSAIAARHIAGHEALTTYALALRLSKRPETAYLAPYVADMRRALNRGRKSTPEELAQKAAARATKAAARAAKAAGKAGATASAAPAATPVPTRSSNE